jgi:hypothetical protein
MLLKRLAISSTKGTQSKRRLGGELKRRCAKCKVRALARERREALTTKYQEQRWFRRCSSSMGQDKMRSIAKGILFAAVGVCAFSAVAVADTKAVVEPQKTDTGPPVTTGSVTSEPPFSQRMSECMAIWDKGTHMTKEQWRRSCQTTLQSLSKN